MPIIICPKCSKKLQVASLPDSGKVKCPGCATVLAVGKPKPPPQSKPVPSQQGVKPPAKPTGLTPAVRPPKPVAASPNPSQATFRPAQGISDMDFGSLSALPAGSGSPMAFPPAGSFQGAAASPLTRPSVGAAPSGKPTAKDVESKANKPLILAIAGIASFLVVGVISFFVVSGLLSEGSSEVTLSASDGDTAPPSTTPGTTDSATEIADVDAPAAEGFELIKFQGATMQVPLGEDVSESLTTAMEFKAVLSNKTNSYYYFGVMDAGVAEIDEEQLQKKVARQFKADFLGGTATERNGYKGIKGMIDGSLFVPRMQCETYVHGERMCVIACAPASMGADVETQLTIDRGAEQAEMEAFLSSLKIGPKPSGSWFF